MKLKLLTLLVCLTSVTANGSAHDTWVQTGPLVTRQRDVVHVDLMLGNHGNNHRDFKLASKITLAPCTLEVIAPDGSRVDLKARLCDIGSAEKEGYWSARIIADLPGVYQVLHTLDTLHGTTRAIKSSKTFFIAAPGFDTLPLEGQEGIHPIAHGLELVLASPIQTLAAGRELRMQVLWNNKPLTDTDVAFIPRGTNLIAEKDPNFERTTDAEGFVSFTPVEGNLLLAVVHHIASDESGEGYDKTHYGATMVLPIPQVTFAK